MQRARWSSPAGNVRSGAAQRDGTTVGVKTHGGFGVTSDGHGTQASLDLAGNHVQLGVCLGGSPLPTTRCQRSK